jgi:hypothetical protein
LADLADFCGFAGSEHSFHFAQPPLSIVDGKTILALNALPSASASRTYESGISAFNDENQKWPRFVSPARPKPAASHI